MIGIIQTNRPKSSTSYLEKKSSEQYWSVVEGVGLLPTQSGIIRVMGKDSLDFLQRLSTNDIASLKIGEQEITVFTNEKGRIVDLVTVFRLSDALLLITSNAYSATTLASWLEKFIIMDDVQLMTCSEDYTIVSLIGNGSKSLILNYDIAEKDVTNVDTLVIQNKYWRIPTFWLIERKSSQQIVESVEYDIPRLMPEVYASIRLEQGVLEFGVDFDDQTNAIEASLGVYVNETKGCYIGQEVIARIRTYKKLKRHLVCLLLEDVRQDEIQQGELITSENEKVGWTTSIGWSFKANKTIALGYLKTDAQGSLSFRSLDGLTTSRIQIFTPPL